MIKPATFEFLNQLAENNNREWFQENKVQYETARENVLEFTTALIAKIADIDSTISASTLAKSCVMRIYRDVRFSKNKDPYKNNFGIAISASGRNVNEPGYYIHVQPEACFIAGGYWMPEAGELKAIRQEIDYDTANFKSIVESKAFEDYYGGLSTEIKLKTAPKGYPADHPEIEYLKLKSFVGSHNYTDKEFLTGNIVDKIAKGLEAIQPLIAFLHNAIKA